MCRVVHLYLYVSNLPSYLSFLLAGREEGLACATQHPYSSLLRVKLIKIAR
jgi:hypothetical protein